MASVTHVKKAQQRYATVPVIDDLTGEPKQTPVMRHDGQQKTTKRGRPVFMTVTRQDRSQPLPPYVCDYCDEPIQVGTAYKHISPKSGPYGGQQRNRHESCPTWQVWDYSSSLSARIAQIAHDFQGELDSAETPDDVQSALQSAADEIRSLAEEKREGAQNIEEGFGHETEKSQELNDIADQLDSWADEVENADVPELPDPEEVECDTCGGWGDLEDETEGAEEGAMVPCGDCHGTGKMTPDDPTEDQIAEWLDEVRDAVSIVDESPV